MNESMKKRERNVDQFNRDVENHEGYAYTGERLSSRLSNRRISEEVLTLADVAGKRVIDVGCGDGTYTMDFVKDGAREVLGVDAAERAVERAAARYRSFDNLRFEVADVYELRLPRQRFDVAVARGILHHLHNAPKAIESISKLAHRLVVVEPNGYSPLLKIIEKVSSYHRLHEEKSYRPQQLDNWFIACGGEVEKSAFIGLVPFFCPDVVAKWCKRLEPFVEKTPLLRAMCCAQYVQKIRMD